MTTPTLTLPEGVFISPGSSQDVTARVLKAQFGNGYVERAADGIHSITGEFQMTIENLPRRDVQTIDAFFRERGGYKAFYFTPPGEASPRLWTCEKWRIAHADATYDTVSATFSEVFTP
ncbi:phage tail protein [Rhizobium sp. P32RR-XVIII]|uniref:phage tail protein n=1 Tax=Rhizobium sp. P32RR-XVIII TaxID=2726738 RepID=UPI0014573A54|nr:phage tail protein [Rhizobium sp. P32RR-XVIII]NLS04619.1 phage tail protein [Rhizobium sp. P32RR-XVIII]